MRGKPAADPLASFHPQWYARLFDRLGARYDDFPFTHGTAQEVEFLRDALGLLPGQRLLDVGCGTGRHAVEFASCGLSVTAVDLSSRLLEIALEHARRRGVLVNFVHADAREIPFRGSYDVALSLCEGAFGLLESPAEDRLVLERVRAALRSGGKLALNALNRLYIESRPERFRGFDPATGTTRYAERMTFESGQTLEVHYQDRAHTPDELARELESAGFEVLAVHGSAPGDFAAHPPHRDLPGLLALARRAG